MSKLVDVRVCKHFELNGICTVCNHPDSKGEICVGADKCGFEYTPEVVEETPTIKTNCQIIIGNNTY